MHNKNWTVDKWELSEGEYLEGKVESQGEK